MAGRLNFLTAGANLPLASNGVKLSKQILVETIEEHEEFKKLFLINEEVLGRIKESIKLKGFDNSQVLHIWKKDEHLHLIDGYTRLRACKECGLTMVPVYEHTFESFEEAYRYALSLQVNRRNLESSELLKNVSFLLGTDFVQSYEGDKSELIASSLGISKRTVQRTIVVDRDASEEVKNKIKQGDLSVYKAYNGLQKNEETNISFEEKIKVEDGDEVGTAPEKKRERCSSKKTKSEEKEESLKRILRSSVTLILNKVKQGFSADEIEKDESILRLLENPFGFDFEKGKEK